MEEISTGVSTELGAAASPTASQGSGAPSEQPSTDVQSQPVQGEAQAQSDDPLTGFPSDDELTAAVANKTPFAEQAARIKAAYEPLKTQHTELENRWKTFEPVADRFEAPEQIQEVVNFYDSLIGWENGPNGLEPATEKGVQLLAEKFPLHADYVAADLLRGESTDPETGQRMPRIDIALAGMAKDPTERAKVARMFGLVEPSSISPQWQPSQEELDYLVSDPDKGATPEERAYQDEYKRVPFDKRQSLKQMDSEFVKEYLDDQKFKRETRERDTKTQQEARVNQERRENYITQQADAAGDSYVQSRLSDALTTFHNSVVEQCNFLQPLDPANLPQGMTPEQATAMNQQIDASNKAEAAQITLSVIGLVNPQTRPFVLPLLKQIGAIDDATVKAIEESSSRFGDNARNYGHLEYRGKLSANGNGYQPSGDITTLRNHADNGLKLLIHTANQIKKNLMEKRSQFFGMKAQNHNQTLNSVATARPSINGGPPGLATTQQPAGFPSRQEIQARYG